MKKILPLLLLCVSLSAFSQTVNISGRCYYDVNGNHVYDGGDSVPANTAVSVYGENITYPSSTNTSGIYSVIVGAGSYDIRVTGPVAYYDYTGIDDPHRDYVNAGSDVVDFAFQQRDSVEQVFSYIDGDNIPLTNIGGTKHHSLIYSYSGVVKKYTCKYHFKF